MKHITLGTLAVGRIGLGAMGMSAAYTGAGADDAESIRTIHRALELGVTLIDTAEVYGPFINEELVGKAIAGRRDEVVVATKFGFMSHRGGGVGTLDSSPENIRIADRRVAAAARHRLHRSLLPAPRRPEHADRGDHRRPRRTRRRRQGPPHRPVRGSATTIRRAHAVHPITALQSEYSLWTRDPEDEVLPGPARAGHRLRGLLAARSRLPDRRHPLDRRPRRRRLAPDQPAFHRRQLPTQPAHRRRRRSNRRRDRRHPGPGRAGLAARPRRRHRPDPRHQARRPRRGEHRRRRHRAHRRSNSTSSTTSPPPPASTTTKPRCAPSTADTAPSPSPPRQERS